MRRVIVSSIILLLLGSALGGCYNRIEMDDTVSVTGFGLDVEGEQKVLSAQVASPSGKPQGGGSAKVESRVLTEKSTGYALAARQIMLRFPRTPIWSHSASLVIGSRVAQKDMTLMMDFIARNRFLRPNLMFFLAAGATPEEVMNVKTPPEESSMIGLVKMIEGEGARTAMYQPITLRDFRSKYTIPGVEPVIPQVEIQEVEGEKQLRFAGIAVFRGTHMVGSLDEKETKGMGWLSSKELRSGLFTVNLASEFNSATARLEDIVTLEIIHSKASFTPHVSGDGILVEIKIESDGNFYEQATTDNLLTSENIARIESLAARVIEDHARACIYKAQSLQSDIFGWGLMISRQNPKAWENLKDNWPDNFSRIQVQFEVDYRIRRAYLTEQPVPIRS